MTGNKRQHHHTTSGQAIVVVAISMVALMAFVALGIDGGRFYTQRRQAQNASDLAALAAIYKYTTIPASTDAQVLAEINRIAELNGIADTNGTTADAVNTNVTAWWVQSSSSGNTLLGTIDNDTTTAPSGANAIKVRAKIPYNTFLGNFIGQPTLTAQADSIARINISFKAKFAGDSSVYQGGAACDNLNDKIGHWYRDTNSAKFKSKVSIEGSLAVGAVNATDFDGNIEVRGPVGKRTSNQQMDTLPYPAYSGTNPFSGNGNKFNNGAQYLFVGTPRVGWGTPGDDNYFYMRQSDGTYTQLDADDFRPAGTLNVNDPGGQWYQLWKKASDLGAPGTPTNFWHVIPTTGNAANNGAAINTAYNAGKRGIYWINGDVDVTGQPGWPDVTLIVKGKFTSSDNNHNYYSAGVTSSSGTVSNTIRHRWAGGISVLAGGDNAAVGVYTNENPDPSKIYLRCASNPSYATMAVTGENTQFFGFVYIPYGQLNLQGNTSGGSNGAQFSKGILTYSLYLKGQSWQLQFVPENAVQPSLVTELQN